MPDGLPQNDTMVFPLSTMPGIKRDGTVFDGNFHVDGQWCRFRNGRPKKIGGYREIVNGLNGPAREIYVHPGATSNIIYNFSDAGITCVPVDNEGVGGATYDRTPGGWATTGYVWTTDTMYDSTGSPSVKIIAHASSSLLDIKSDTATVVYYGDASATSALVTTGQSVSGGVVVLQPYAFLYGSNGLIKNSVANDPGTYIGGDSNTANVAGTKIVRGLPLRGGSNAPAGLFWALDLLIRVSFVGGTAKWRYDPVSGKSSVLSAKGMVEVDGVFYWAGIDRFLMYNGVVKEIPNPMNQDFFFDNINWSYRQKVWGTALPRWGEIWWHFPKGSATECNHAVVFNYRENTWYDTPSFRSAGMPPRILYFPTWGSSQSNNDVSPNKYRLYRHETGTDHVYGENQVAVPSYYETSDVGLAGGGIAEDAPASPNVGTRITRIEPDFMQTGDMTVEVTGSVQAESAVVTSAPLTFPPSTGKIDIREQRRILRLRFSSNVAGGSYHAGRVIMHLEKGDVRE